MALVSRHENFSITKQECQLFTEGWSIRFEIETIDRLGIQRKFVNVRHAAKKTQVYRGRFILESAWGLYIPEQWEIPSKEEWVKTPFDTPEVVELIQLLEGFCASADGQQEIIRQTLTKVRSEKQRLQQDLTMLDDYEKQLSDKLQY